MEGTGPETGREAPARVAGRPLTALPRLLEPVAARPGLAGAAHPSRGMLHRFLQGERAQARDLQAEYEGQARDWAAWVGSQPDYLLPLLDALDRGVPASLLDGAHLAWEVGAGPGTASGLLVQRGADLVVSDISLGMLRRAPAGLRCVQCDVAALPLPDSSVHLLVGLNAVPSWSELRRVLAPAGCLVWASSYGEETPLYVPPAGVADQFPDRGSVTATAGHGDWVCVLPVEVPCGRS